VLDVKFILEKFMTEQPLQPISNLESGSDDSVYVSQLEVMSRKLEELGDGDNKLQERIKIMDEIVRLQGMIKKEKREKEKYWTTKQFVDWARDEVGADDPEAWLENHFDLNDIANPRLKGVILVLNELKTLNRLPPNIKGSELYASYSKLEAIPANNVWDEFHADHTQITEIPSGFRCGELYLFSCKIDKVGDDVKIDKLSVSRKSITKSAHEKMKQLEKEGKIGRLIDIR
jgi:hypothetical protein